MTISKDLLLAILSMDSYNQGYGKGLDHGKMQIGLATIEKDCFRQSGPPGSKVLSIGA